MSCLLQKIMRREYIKAQNPSTFKEQLALIKNTPGKARGLGERRESLRHRLGHNSHLCFTASARRSCSLGVPPPPRSGTGGVILGTTRCPGSVSFDCRIKEKYGKHISFAHFPPAIDLQSCGCSSALGQLAHGARVASQPALGMRICSQQPETRVLPRTQSKGGQKKSQTSLVINPSEDAILLPGTERPVENDFACQWLCRPVPGRRQRGCILRGR